MAIQAYWELSRRGDKTVELIKNKLSRVTQVIDDFEVKKSFTKDLETEKAASRVALLDKVIATNPKVVHAVAVNRALSLLVRIDTAAARQLLTDFAFSNELEEKIVNEARRLKDIETAKGRHGQ